MVKKVKKPPKIKIPKNYVWAPQPGPQAYAATCPADATFFGGTRGGGKSDCLIGRHIRGVEKYGNHWNGLILRRKFKEFSELRRRWDELIAAGLPAERIGGDQQTNYVRFPKHGNAQIVMTAVQRAEMLDAFQSQQFCVAEKTPILMADGSYKNIENVVKGDYVQTLSGKEKVSSCMPPRLSPCVLAVTPFGKQFHPVNHPIFSTSGWQSYASILENYSIKIEQILQESHIFPDVDMNVILYQPKRDQDFFSKQKPNLFYTSYKSYQQSKDLLINVSNPSLVYSDLMQPAEQSLLSFDYTTLPSFYDDIAYGHPYSGIILNYLSVDQSYLHFHGEQPPYRKENGLSALPLPNDVALPFHYNYNSGGQDNTPSHIPAGELSYEHPYSSEVLQSTVDTI